MSGAKAAKPASTDTDAVSDQTSAAEPSMDDILASIRQIIIDQNADADEAAAKAAADVANPEPPVDKIDSVIGPVAPRHWAKPKSGTDLAAELESNRKFVRKPIVDDAKPVLSARSSDAESGPTSKEPAPIVRPDLDELIGRIGTPTASYKAKLSDNQPDPAADVPSAKDQPQVDVVLPDTSVPVKTATMDLGTADPADKKPPKLALDRLLARKNGRSGDRQAVSAGSATENAPQPSSTTSSAGSAKAPPTLPVLKKSMPVLAEHINAAMTSSFDRFALSMFERRGDEMGNVLSEMLRPMLQNWLEDNLPSLVERLVREEIERVSRGPQPGN